MRQGGKTRSRVKLIDSFKLMEVNLTFGPHLRRIAIISTEAINYLKGVEM